MNAVNEISSLAIICEVAEELARPLVEDGQEIEEMEIVRRQMRNI